MEIEALKGKLNQFPKKNLLWGKPPLKKAWNLSTEWGVDVYIKRDDLTGLALGGNKSRKLEYLLGDALHHNCDTIITAGGVNSNHALQTAVAARKAGMHPVLALWGAREYGGNLLLDRMMTEDIHFFEVSSSQELHYPMRSLAEQLKAEGKKPYISPVGGSSPVGVLGYVEAAVELLEEQKKAGEKFDYVVFPSSSGGTAAGLLLGLNKLSSETKLLGIGVGDPWEEIVEDVANLVSGASEILGMENEVPRESIANTIVDGYGFGGYGSLEREVVEIIKYAASKEGFFLDPVYTGKCFWGLFDLVRNGNIPTGSKVLFLHTGGLGGLFQYQDFLANNLW